MRKRCIVILSLFVGACGSHNTGKKSITATVVPEAADVIRLSVRAMRGGGAVAGAQIETPNQNKGETEAIFTDNDGFAAISAEVKAGQTVKIECPGFLPLRMNLKAGNQIVYLWADDKLLPADFTSKIIYDEGTQGLHRPVETPLTILPRGAMLTNRKVKVALPEAVKKINNIIAGRAEFVIDSGGDAATEPEFPVEVVYNPDNHNNPGELTWAYATNDGVIYKVVIELATIDGFWGIHLQRVFQHALDHALGLGHAPGYQGIMGDLGPAGLEFSSMEREVMRNIFRREPGNRFPDTQPGVSMQGSAGMQTRLLCAIPAP